MVKMFERRKEEENKEEKERNELRKKIARFGPVEGDNFIQREQGREKIAEQEELVKKRKQESRKSDNKNMDYTLSSGIAAMFRRIEEE